MTLLQKTASFARIRAFTEKFPQEFRLGAMNKAVVPSCDGRPFVCPDGKCHVLFCQTLSKEVVSNRAVF
jgi:hypothetical protein